MVFQPNAEPSRQVVRARWPVSRARPSTSTGRGRWRRDAFHARSSIGGDGSSSILLKRTVEFHVFARPNRETPSPDLDYHKAEQNWDDQMGSARPGHELSPVACCPLLATGLAGGPVW